MPITKTKKRRKPVAAKEPRPLYNKRPSICSETILNMLDRKIRELDSKGQSTGRVNSCASRTPKKRPSSAPDRRCVSSPPKAPGKSILRKNSSSEDPYFSHVNSGAECIDKKNARFFRHGSPTPCRDYSSVSSTNTTVPDCRSNVPFHSVPAVVPPTSQAKECRVRFKSDYLDDQESDQQQNTRMRTDPSQSLNFLLKKYTGGSGRSCRYEPKFEPRVSTYARQALNVSCNKSSTESDWEGVKRLGADILSKYSSLFSEGSNAKGITSSDDKSGAPTGPESNTTSGSEQVSSPGLHKWSRSASMNFDRGAEVGTDFDSKRNTNDFDQQQNAVNGLSKSVEPFLSKYCSKPSSMMGTSFSKPLTSGSYGSSSALNTFLKSGSMFSRPSWRDLDFRLTGLGASGKLASSFSSSYPTSLSSESSFKRSGLDFSYLTSGGSASRNYNLSKSTGFSSGSPYVLQRSVSMNNSNITSPGHTAQRGTSSSSSHDTESGQSSVDKFVDDVVTDSPPNAKSEDSNSKLAGGVRGAAKSWRPGKEEEEEAGKTYRQLFESYGSSKNNSSCGDYGQVLTNVGGAKSPRSYFVDQELKATTGQGKDRSSHIGSEKGGGRGEEGGLSAGRKCEDTMVDIMKNERGRLSKLESIIGKVTKSLSSKEQREK